VAGKVAGNFSGESPDPETFSQITQRISMAYG
jgi:hypothetical protein